MESQKVFGKEVLVDGDEDWFVMASRGYGDTVSLKIEGDRSIVEFNLDPDDARQVGLALMDAANALLKSPATT